MTLTDPKNWEGEWKGVRRWNRVNDIDVQEVECRPDLNEHLQSTSSKVHVRSELRLRIVLAQPAGQYLIARPPGGRSRSTRPAEQRPPGAKEMR